MGPVSNLSTLLCSRAPIKIWETTNTNCTHKKLKTGKIEISDRYKKLCWVLRIIWQISRFSSFCSYINFSFKKLYYLKLLLIYFLHCNQFKRQIKHLFLTVLFAQIFNLICAYLCFKFICIIFYNVIMRVYTHFLH